MMYGTNFDNLTRERHKVGPVSHGGYSLAGLAAPAYTGEAWVKDPSTADLVSKYGRISRDRWPRNSETVTYDVGAQSKSADGKYAYLHLIGERGTTLDLVIALQPTTSRGLTTYNPVLYSYKINSPEAPKILPGGDVKTPNTPTVSIPEQQPILVKTTQQARGEVALTTAPTAPAPEFLVPFPPLDAGFSYVLAENESMKNAPGGNIDLFRASAYSVGQNVPYMTSRNVLTQVPAIVVGSDTAIVPISGSELNDRWEYKKEQIPGPATDKIYFKTTLRNLSKNGPSIVYNYDVSGGGKSIGDIVKDISIQDVAHGITFVSTLGQSDLLIKPIAREAGVSEDIIDKAELAYAAAATAVAAYGAGTMLLAPTTAATAAAPAAAETAAVGTATAGGATATTTTAATVATGAAGTVAKTVGAAALGVGSQAVKTGLEKLTGQLPDEESYDLVSPSPIQDIPAPQPAKLNIPLLAAAAGLLIFLKNRG